MKFIYMVLLFTIDSFVFSLKPNIRGIQEGIIYTEKNVLSQRKISLPEAPFVAVIERYPLSSLPEKDYCGATILTGQWLLSSAACFFTDKNQDPMNLTLENFVIVTGASKLPPNTTEASRHHIQEVHLSTKDADSISEKVVLIKSETEVDGRQTPIPIGLPRDKPKDSQTVTLYGFHLNETEGGSAPLTKTNMNIVSACYEEFSTVAEEDVFCSENYENSQGISINVLTGTSVVRNSKLVGLVANEFYSDTVKKYYIILNIVDMHHWISNTIFARPADF